LIASLRVSTFYKDEYRGDQVQRDKRAWAQVYRQDLIVKRVTPDFKIGHLS